MEQTGISFTGTNSGTSFNGTDLGILGIPLSGSIVTICIGNAAVFGLGGTVTIFIGSAVKFFCSMELQFCHG